MEHIFELRMKDQREERSSQLVRNLSSCENIYIHLFILHGYITNSQYDQLPVGLIPQLVEHCTGIAEVMGSNPVQAWIFFRLSFRNCLSCVLTARIFLLFDLSSAVQIYVPYIYIHLHFFFLFIGRQQTTWPANNCLQMMVCSCAILFNCILLQIK